MKDLRRKEKFINMKYGWVLLIIGIILFIVGIIPNYNTVIILGFSFFVSNVGFLILILGILIVFSESKHGKR